MMKKKLLHKLGLCYKHRLGYSCKGRRNFEECGSKND